MLPWIVLAVFVPVACLPPGILGDSHGLIQLHSEASLDQNQGAGALAFAQAAASRESTSERSPRQEEGSSSKSESSCDFGPLVHALRRRDRMGFATAAQDIHNNGCREEDIVQAMAPEVESDVSDAASFLDTIFHGDSSSPSFASVRINVDATRRGDLLTADQGERAPSEDAGNSIFFAHIPKNAGTAIEHAGFESGVVWGRNAFLALNITHAWLGGRPMPDNNICSFHHIPPGQFADPNPYDGRRVFCVTRDPYDRIVSDYRYLTRNAGKWWTPLYWWFGLHRNGMSTSLLCSPEGLNHFVQTSLLVYQRGSRYINDCHMIPQHEYIWSESMHRWCDDVIPMHELSTRFADLMAEIGSDVRLADEPANDSGDDCPSLTTQDLSDQTVTMLDLVYRDDFEMLGYPYRGPNPSSQEQA